MLPEAEPRPEDPTLADVLARPKFSATAHVAEAIEKRLDENADIVLRRNEGTCDLTRLFPAYHKSMLPLVLSMNGAAEPGRHADSYAWHPAAHESFAANKKKNKAGGHEKEIMKHLNSCPEVSAVSARAFLMI